MSKYRMETAVEQFLDSIDVEYHRESDIHSYMIQGDNFRDYMVTVCVPRETSLCCTVAFRREIPERIRGRMAEALCQINCTLPMGNFQMDMSDGQLLFHIGSAHSDEQVTDRELAILMETAISTAERYADDIRGIIVGRMTAEDIAGIEPSEEEMTDFEKELQRALSTLDEEFGELDIYAEEPDDYSDLLESMTDRQLEQLSDAVFTEMGRQVNIERKLGSFPEEYAELAACLSRQELLELSLALLNENFRRLHPEGKEDTSMSDEEISRRKASASLKETLVSRMFAETDLRTASR